MTNQITPPVEGFPESVPLPGETAEAYRARLLRLIPTMKEFRILAECVGARVESRRESGLRIIYLHAPEGYRWTTVKDILGYLSIAVFAVHFYTSGDAPLSPVPAAIARAYAFARGGLQPVPGRKDLPPLHFPELVRLPRIVRYTS